MKKILTLLTSLSLIATPASLVTSCATENSNHDAVTPPEGWPPVEQSFLQIWKNFRKQVQQDNANSVGGMFNQYTKEYVELFNKYKDINKDKRKTSGYDEYGVPNSDIDKILNNLAVSKDMYNYQKNSIRLYYIEINIAILEGRPKQVTQDEELNIWAMKYFRSYPFYDSVQITLHDPNPVIHQVAIQYNFADFGQYVQYNENTGDPDWSLPPDETASEFHPILKLKESYDKMADKVYDELFGKGKQND